MQCNFDQLTPECFINTLEKSLNCELNGFASAFHSYINRVYELQTAGGERLVVKFYRPERWSADAILDEHDYLWECEDAGIPVVPPFEFENGSTLDFYEGIPFAVFPKKRGRDVSFESIEDLRQIGTLVARLHSVGSRRRAEYRITLEPVSFINSVIDRLADSAFPREALFNEFIDLCDEVIDISSEVFPRESSFLRLHGDLHRANILKRPEEGLILIDFDDMLNGPPVQDLWLLLPDAPGKCPDEARAIADGYRMFMEFDDRSFAVAECLRMMRMLYFLSWCAMQKNDVRFHENFPDWGTENYWRGEFADLRRQIPVMKEEIAFWNRPRW